ncbi:MAG: hypothetical protein WA989_09665 [Henriciella sp.]|uniref:hypothetical protein n=1 Tax=Henriciella sp. TaxID=1968823 RepID=UPI003C72B3BA
MKHVWQAAVFAGALMTLSGCFMSTTALIAPGAAVLPVDGDMVACLQQDDPCIPLERAGDGYFAESPGEFEEGVTLRFAPLAQAGGKQIFIAEAELEADEGPAFAYGLARRLAEPDARGATLQVAPLDCEDADDALIDQFRSEGGEVEDGKLLACMPVSLEQLSVLILAVHGADIESDAWWAERGEEF